MTEEFNKWWDSEGIAEDKSYREGSPVFWAWEGWQAAMKAEREKVAQWMMQHGYATGHGDTTEDLLAELDWQIAENWNRAMINGVKTEREACAKVCDVLADKHTFEGGYANECAIAIRARGQG